MRKRILTILLAMTCALQCFSQPYCNVRTFTIRDGLATNTISSFLQTKDGLMWFSTWNGLCFYDGYRFTTFRNSPGAGEVLTTNRIMLIRPSATGNVWCCTSDRHVYLFDTRECRFVNVGQMIKEKYGHDIPVRNIYPLPNGHTWLMSNDNGANYRINDDIILGGEGIEQYSTANRKLRSRGLKKAELDDDGQEWVFGSGGIQLIGEKFHHDIPFEYMVQLKSVVFFASEDGKVFAYDKKSGVMAAVHMPDGVTRINSVVRQNATRVLFATNAGIAVYDMAGRTVSMVSVQTPAQPSAEVTSLYVDKRQRIWAYTGSPGIVMLDRNGKSPLWLMAKADIPIHRTSCDNPFIHEDNYGTVWTVPADGTFSYYDETERRLVPYMLRTEALSDIYLPSITKFTFDKENNLWFTGTRDVNLVNFRYHHFKLTSVQPSQEVRSLLIDRHGRTWAGTYNGQLAVFDADRKLMGYMNRNGKLQKEKTDFSNRIYTMYEDSRGRIWIGTKGRGLYMIDEKGSLRQFVSNPDDRYSISHNDIYDIDADRRGHIWVGSYEGGLNLVDEHGGGIRFINHKNELRQYPMKQFGRIRRITHTGNGNVILSTTDGLVTFADNFSQPDKIRFYSSCHIVGDTTSLTASDVLQTLVTRNGNILVVTLGGGIQQLASKNLLQDNLKFHDLANAKPDEGIIQSMAENNKGNLWIMREGSIDQYNLSTGKLSQYGPGNIGNGIELSEAKPAHDPKSDFISVAARGGFVSFNSKDLTKSNYRPNIVFTGVLYHGANKTEPILGKDVLDVPSDCRNLTIYFAALEYSDKYLVKYAYKIEGVDDNWNYVGDANSASFNRLPPGHYKLLVKSTNSDGVWVDNVTALNIYAHPTFWETGWAWLLYLLLACAVIYVAIYIYMLRAKALLARDLDDMKTKFFTEISHKLRTPLTLIGGPVAEILSSSGLTDTARKHLEMVQRNATRMLDLVNKMLKYSMSHGVYISDENAKEQLHTDGTDSSAAIQVPSAPAHGDIRLLIVEDNDDLRAFLVSILSSDYSILQAENGQRGLEIAETQMPDFIITDVMMPVMDGLTMVHRIKQNNDICHIPIIVLSAKASLEDRLHGLQEGIDDYITKPFSAVYLKLRVGNIISQRHMLQQTYVEQIKPEDRKTYKLESPQIVDADNEMMKKLLSYLEEHVGDPSMKIEDLAEAVNLGRSVFYGKIKSIVGMTPVDFVRHIRIQRAEELIAKSNYSFSQIAYSVGFSDPKYFSKCFKKETGMTPSEYREKGGQSEEEQPGQE